MCSNMMIGGGTTLTLSDVLVRTFALAVGCFAKQTVIALAFGLLGVAAAVVSLYWLWREKSDLFVFFAVAIFIAPALLLMVQRTTQLYERYFYLNLLFFWILLSYFLGQLWQRGSSARAVALVALAAIVAGNCRLTADFLTLGRGHFLQALEYMVDHSVRPSVTIANNGKRTRDVVYATVLRSLRAGQAQEYRLHTRRFPICRLSPSGSSKSARSNRSRIRRPRSARSRITTCTCWNAFSPMRGYRA